MQNGLGIIVGVILLILLVYRRVNPLLSALAASFVAGLLNGQGIWEITDTFASGMVSFMQPILLLFVISAIYGKLMEKTGNAASIANFFMEHLGQRFSILAIILATTLLVYGGISVFTVIFAIYPIAMEILQKNRIPKFLLPGIIVIGQITFSMTALPGTPQMNNIIPGQFFGTTLYAAPLLGLIAATVMFVLSFLYIMRVIRKYEGTAEEKAEQSVLQNGQKIPPFWKAVLPIFSLIIIYFLLANDYINNEMTIYQSVELAMTLSCILIILLNLGQPQAIITGIREGCSSWISPLINLCIIIGFGSVVRSTAGFLSFVEALQKLEFHPYVSAALTTMLLSGVTGSASGGIQLSCSTFADTWMAYPSVNPQILHRICSVSSCALDSLPHSGGIYGTFEVCRVELNKGYRFVFVVSVLIPLVSVLVIVPLGLLGIC